MERLHRLPQMALTDLQPCFYDIESVSTVEMVAKLYKYIQNMVDDYNVFINEVNSEIDAFEKCTNQSIDCFKKCVKNLLDNYIDSIDIKIQNQDTKISEAIEEQNEVIQNAVDYMKSNLITTLNNLFSLAIQNGDIVADLGVDYNSNTEELTFYILGTEGSVL